MGSSTHTASRSADWRTARAWSDSMTITSAQITDKSEQALRFSDLPLPLGRSEAMRRVHDRIRRLASTDTTTLIYGETGTGKELVATALHRLSRRGSGPYLCVNCGGLPDGLVESELFGHVRGAFTGAFQEPDDSRPRTAVPFFSTRSATSRPRCRSVSFGCWRLSTLNRSAAIARARSMYASLPQRTNRSGTKWAPDDFAGTFTIASTSPRSSYLRSASGARTSRSSPAISWTSLGAGRGEG